MALPFPKDPTSACPQSRGVGRNQCSKHIPCSSQVTLSKGYACFYQPPARRCSSHTSAGKRPPTRRSRVPPMPGQRRSRNGEGIALGQPDQRRERARRNVVPGTRTIGCHVRRPFLPRGGRETEQPSRHAWPHKSGHAPEMAAGSLDGTIAPSPISGEAGGGVMAWPVNVSPAVPAVLQMSLQKLVDTLQKCLYQSRGMQRV